MTSSPGPMPTASSARCSAVVQLDTATACARAGERGELLFERGDLGSLGDPAGENHAARGIGLALVHHGFDDGDHQAAILSLLARHQSTRRARPSSRSMVERKPNFSAAFFVQASRRDTGLTLRSGPYSGLSLRAHHAQQRGGEIVEAGLDAARDVEHVVADVGLQREDVGARHVLDVDEVHRGLAVAEDQRRLAGGDAIHPADQHFGVAAVDVHARAVHVEVAQRHVGQVVHVVERAQQAFEHDLARAVPGAVAYG